VLFRLPFSFPGVLRRLGITDPAIKFDLSSSVVPVSLVDSDIVIPTSTLPPLFGSPATIGETNNPAANTRMADTAALAAGTWFCQFIYSSTAGTINYRIKRRDAADAADVWSITQCNPAAAHDNQLTMHLTIAQSERLVIEHVTGGVGGICQGAIFATKTG
jgi:hypothetical protein